MRLVFLVETKDLQKSLLKLRYATDLDRLYTDVAISCPGGDEVREVEYHRFGDYFDKIDVRAVNETSYTIQIDVKENVRRFWKDLMVDVLGVAVRTGATRYTRTEPPIME